LRERASIPCALFVPVSGAAILRCCSASTPAGVMFAMALRSLFCQPLTTSSSPRIIASKPVFCDVGGIVLRLRGDFGVEHVGTLKKSVSVAPGMRQVTVTPEPLRAQREGERINERLRAIIDCLVSAGHEAGDRSGDQDASLASRAHVAADFLNDVNGDGDVRVDDVEGGVEVLIEKGFA